MIHIHVDNINEFARLFIPSERVDLSEAVVDVIESNLNNTKTVLKDIKVFIKDANTDIILSIKRNEFVNVLEEQLQLFEEIEYYEKCAQITKILRKIKAGAIVHSLVNQYK